MSANRCFAVLLQSITSPVRTTGQASKSLSVQPLAPRKQKVVAKRSQVSSIRTLSTATTESSRERKGTIWRGGWSEGLAPIGLKTTNRASFCLNQIKNSGLGVGQVLRDS